MYEDVVTKRWLTARGIRVGLKIDTVIRDCPGGRVRSLGIRKRREKENEKTLFVVLGNLNRIFS